MSGRRLSVASFALAAICFFAGLGAIPLTQPDEGRNAAIAFEMQREGAFWVPTSLGFPYLDKPAFFFGLSGLAQAVFGRNEAAARLPSAIFAFLAAAIVFAFVRRTAGERRAALTVMVLATMPLFVAFARLVIFDMALTAFVTGAILAGFLAETGDARLRRRWLVVAAASAGFATLVKGPVGAVLPIAVHLAASRANGTRGALRRAFAPAPLLAFLLVVSPWLVGVSLRAPDFLEYGILVESAQRLTSTEFRRNAPLWFYAPLLLAGGLPWSFLFAPGAWLAWRRRTQLDPLDRLAAAWVVVMVGLFTLSQSKQPAYVVPVCVGLALGVARMIELALSNPEGTCARIVRVSFACLAAPLALAAAMLGTASLRGDLVGRLPPMNPPWTTWAGVFPAVALVCAGAAAILAWATRKRSLGIGIGATALLLPALVGASVPAFVRYAESRSSRVLASGIPSLPEDAEIACLRAFPSALPFYLDRRFVLVSDDFSELRSNYVPWALARGKGRPSSLLLPEELEGWLASRRSAVYLLAGEDERARLLALAAKRGVAVNELAPELWGALLPPPGGN